NVPAASTSRSQFGSSVSWIARSSSGTVTGGRAGRLRAALAAAPSVLVLVAAPSVLAPGVAPSALAPAGFAAAVDPVAPAAGAVAVAEPLPPSAPDAPASSESSALRLALKAPPVRGLAGSGVSLDSPTSGTSDLHPVPRA